MNALIHVVLVFLRNRHLLLRPW